MPILWITWLRINCLHIGPNKIGTNFIRQLSTLFGMTLIYLNIVPIKSLGDAFQNMNNKASSLFAMIMHVEVILDLIRQLLKFYNVVFIGRRYLTIVIYIVQLVIDANDWEALGREI